MTKQEAIRILNEQRNKFMDEFIDYGGVNEAYNMAISLLKEQEPKSGHWTVLKNCSNAGVYCSECQTKVFDHYPMPKKLSRFCPHCGAKMEEKE